MRVLGIGRRCRASLLNQLLRPDEPEQRDQHDAAQQHADPQLAELPQASLAGDDGGNLVVVASDAPLDVAAVVERMGERDLAWDALAGAGLAAWVGDAPVLTDDHAPVDQLLTPYAR